jgi:hypothetical protein
VNQIETALKIVELFNATAPGVASLIMLIRRNDGTVSVVTMLDEADSAFDANIKTASDWLAAHPK